MRIGLFGGSFDPVHLGHLLLAESCREQASLDEVWFCPTRISPHKTAASAPAEDRFEMLRLATAGHPAFQVRDDELRREGVSFTVDTLRDLDEQAPRQRLVLPDGAPTCSTTYLFGRRPRPSATWSFRFAYNALDPIPSPSIIFVPSSTTGGSHSLSATASPCRRSTSAARKSATVFLRGEASDTMSRARLKSTFGTRGSMRGRPTLRSLSTREPRVFFASEIGFSTRRSRYGSSVGVFTHSARCFLRNASVPTRLIACGPSNHSISHRSFSFSRAW